MINCKLKNSIKDYDYLINIPANKIKKIRINGFYYFKSNNKP